MISIIISDLHLGARNNRSELLVELLHTSFDRLVLNGDTVDSLDLRRFSPWDWRVVERLHRIARDRELVLIRGNHDGKGVADSVGFGSLNVLPRLLQTELHEDYELEVGSDRYLVLHGDRFDDTLNLTWVGNFADWFYRQTQWASKPFAHFLKSCVKHWGGVVESVQRGALLHAEEKGYDGVITGHTHFCQNEYHNGIHYLNTGCWVDWPCSYVRVDGSHVQLLHWSDRSPLLTSSAMRGGTREREQVASLLPAQPA
jgi:UDP-2,3-diacylglucosamine pyrophosphatase LpxH